MGLDVRNFVFITEDLILDRLRPDQREGKLLLDLEDVHNFNCLINEPSRVTTCSQTQLDVILTNKPEDFKFSGVLDPELSDHAMVYDLMKCRVKHHPRKVFSFRDYASMDQERLKEDLVAALWQIMKTFDSMDDKYGYWSELLLEILDKHAPIKNKRLLHI